MANGLQVPIQPPRPAFCSLPAAVKAAIKAAIAHGNTLSNINAHRWAETYAPATTEDVKAEFEKQLSEASLRPSNSYEEPFGK